MPLSHRQICLVAAKLEPVIDDIKDVLQSAETRGLKVSDTQVMLCGVRFNLLPRYCIK